MEDDERQREETFHDMAEDDKKRHEQEMANYEPRKDEKGKGKKRKRSMDPITPRRCAFFWFCQEERPKVKETNTDLTVGEIAKEVCKRWNEGGEELQSKYKKMSADDKARYDKDKARYDKNKARYDKDKARYDKNKARYDKDKARYKDKACYGKDKARYDKDKASYDKDKASYDKDKAHYDTDKARYDKEIEAKKKAEFDDEDESEEAEEGEEVEC